MPAQPLPPVTDVRPGVSQFGGPPDWVPTVNAPVGIERRVRYPETYLWGSGIGQIPVNTFPATTSGNSVLSASPGEFIRLRDSFVSEIFVLYGLNTPSDETFAIRLQVRPDQWTTIDPFYYWLGDQNASVVNFRIPVRCPVFAFAVYSDGGQSNNYQGTIAFY